MADIYIYIYRERERERERDSHAPPGCLELGGKYFPAKPSQIRGTMDRKTFDLRFLRVAILGEPCRAGLLASSSFFLLLMESG